MATWTAPTTRASGALITATIWNTDLVENLKYLKDAPVIDTAVIIGAATTSGIRLDLESGTLAVREGDDSAYGPLIASVINIPSTGSINFASSDVTITHSANTLAFAGASTAYTFADGPVRPATNDGAALGVSGTAWSDLFLASGGVINFNAGDVTITHGTDKISVEGGDLTVGTTTAQGRITALTTQGNATVANAIMAYGANTSWPIGFSNVYDASFVDSIFSINTRPVSGSRGSVLYSGSTAGYVLYVNGDGTGALSFQSVPGGSNQSATERMRITSGGNVGIGTTSPDRKLQLQVSPTSTGDDGIRVSDGTYTPTFGLTGSAYSYRGVPANAALIYNGGPIALLADAASTISFHANGAERMRVTSNGNVAIGATARIYLDGVAGTGDTYIEETSANSATLAAGGVLYRWNTGSYFPVADNSQNCGSGSFRWAAVFAVNGTIQTSDRTLKRDISTDTLGLNFIQRLRPVSFTMHNEADGVRRHGLIAQDVIEAAQDTSLVGILTGDKDGEYGLNYAGFVPALIKAVQEQQERIAALEARLN